jgi:hypothetical protein
VGDEIAYSLRRVRGERSIGVSHNRPGVDNHSCHADRVSPTPDSALER